MKEDTNNSINVILVDDHPIVLNGLKNLLSDLDIIDTITDLSNGKEALLKLETNKIDLIITDISMPEIDGIELTKCIKTKYPHIKVLILTAHNEQEILKNVLLSGAEGCLLKNSSKKELFQAINKVIDNGYYYCDEILSIARNIHKSNNTPIKEPVSLSKRELEVLELILLGLSNKEIGEKLIISYHTVCSHRKNILRKTDNNNISGLYAYSKKHNLFPSLFDKKTEPQP